MDEELWRRKTWQMSVYSGNTLQCFHLDIGGTHGNLAGNNVIEIDRYKRRDIVIRIRIIRIGPAAGSPGKEKHEAKDEAAQRSVRKKKHSCQSSNNPGKDCT
jgi:hypothetical protein